MPIPYRNRTLEEELGELDPVTGEVRYRPMQPVAPEPAPGAEVPPPRPQEGPGLADFKRLAQMLGAAQVEPPAAPQGPVGALRDARAMDILDAGRREVAAGAAQALGRRPASSGQPLGMEAGVSRDLAMSEAQVKKARQASMLDPASQESERARAQLKALDPKMAELLGPQFGRMSAAYLSEHFPMSELMKGRREVAKFQMERTAKGEEKAEDRKLEEERYQRRRGEGLDDAEARARRLQPLELEKVRAAAQVAEGTRLSAEERALARKLEEEARSEERQKREAAAKLSAEKQKAVLGVEERYRNLREAANMMRKQLREGNTWQPLGAHNRQLLQQVVSLATDYAKFVDPDSVAREGEVALARQQLPEPTPWMLRSTALELLDSFDKLVDSKRKSAFEVRGLQVPVSVVGESTAGDGTVIQKLSDGTYREKPKG